MPKILCIPLYVPNAIQMPCSSHILLRSRIFLRASSSQARLKATHGALGEFRGQSKLQELGLLVRCALSESNIGESRAFRVSQSNRK